MRDIGLTNRFKGAFCCLFVAAGLLVLGGCSGEPTSTTDQPSPSTAWNDAATPLSAPSLPIPSLVTDSPLIPREHLVGMPNKILADISPDGLWISWLAAHEGSLNVWVAPIADMSLAKAVTHEKMHGIENYRWAYNSSNILFTRDYEGDENFHVYSVNIKTLKQVDLTPGTGVNAYWQKLSPLFPDHVVLASNHRDKAFHDLYITSVHDGSSKLLFQNSEFSDTLVDDDFHLRFVRKNQANGGYLWFVKAKEKQWQEFAEIPYGDALTTSPIGFVDDGTSLLWLDTRGRDKAAIAQQNIASKAIKLLFESVRGDIDNYNLHPSTKALRAVSTNYMRSEWKVLNEADAADFAYLQQLGDGEFWIDGSSHDDRRWVVTYTESNRSDKTYLYNRDTRTASLLFVVQPELDSLALSSMHAREIGARDGLTLVSYLSLPTHSDADGDGVPNEPLPMVLLVHGGPWDRDFWGFNVEHQWLSNRGYAVLSVNFRGSTGFGKRFTNAGNGEWAGKMHDDLVDAVQWAIKAGIADESKVAIFGGSYGGYAALVGLTFTPDTFACAIDVVGPSNLESLLQNFPAYWQSSIEQFQYRVGDYRTPEGRAFLASRSPLTFVDKIRKPLLIAHGGNDPRVTAKESERIVNAMVAKNIPVTYLVFPDEGHGFLKPENSKAFYAVAEEFLSRCLGGKMLEQDEDFVDASLQIRVGDDLIPYAKEALAKRRQQNALAY